MPWETSYILTVFNPCVKPGRGEWEREEKKIEEEEEEEERENNA